MHSNPVPLAQKRKPWPSYFLVRTTGEVVPLIAVDELPPGTHLIGVPRSLDLEDTIGMLNLGLQRSSGSFYRTVSGHGVVETRIGIPEHAVRECLSEGPRTSADITPPSTPPKPSRIQEQSSPTATPNTGPNLTPDATQLCRHWCHHGICKWGQHCRYRHSMPMSLSGLSEVGLADWPVWFRRMNPGYFAAESVQRRALGGRGGGGRRKGCTSAGGNGGACCGVLHGPGGVVAIGGAGGERYRKERVVCVRERGARATSSEELGEQIITRFRGMAREEKERVVASGAERVLSGNALVERAALRDAKNWEDESSDEGETNEPEKTDEGKGKLLDV